MHEFSPSAGTVRGVRSERQNLTNGTVVFSLYTTTALNFIGPEIITDMGCTILSEYMSLNLRANQTQPFRPYRPGRFLDSPQPEIVLRPNVWMNLDFEMEIYSMEHRFTLQGRPMTYRRTDTGFQPNPGEKEFPFTITDEPAVPPRWSDNKMEIHFRVKAPNELEDYVFQMRLTRVESNRSAEVISRFIVSYFVDMHTAGMNKPLIAVTKCSPWEPEPYEEGNVVIVPRRVNTPGCLILRVDGNPLPRYTMREMTGDTMGAVVVPRYPGHWSETLDLEVYPTPALAIGT